MGAAFCRHWASSHTARSIERAEIPWRDKLGARLLDRSILKEQQSMMMTIEAEAREDFGKNSSRRLRHAGRIPGVVYGGGGQAIPVTVDPKKVSQILHSESGHNTVFTLEVKGRAPARVMLCDWQVEPVQG